MRSAEDLAGWARGGLPRVWRRRLGAVGLVALVVVASGWAVWAAAGVYVAWLWFDSLGYSDIYSRRTIGQAVAFVAGSAFFGLLYVGSVRLSRRLGPSAEEATGPADEGLWTYLARVSAGLGDGPRRTAVRRAERTLLAVGALLAVVFGLVAASTWERWLLALLATPFDLAEPLFGRDVGFYVFLLPLLRTVHGWALAALLAIGLATAAAYVTRGRYELNLPPRSALLNLSRAATQHLAYLVAGLFGLIALHHQLSLAEVVFASTGQAFRLSFPGYVEAHARVPALWGMTLAAVIAAGAVAWTARRPPTRRLLLGPALWLTAVVVGTVYPAAVQALAVKPNEAVLERPYLAHMIQMARAAYGLDGLAERTISVEESPRPDLAQSNLGTLSNLRLWEPEPLRLALNQLQAARPYYGFFLYPDVDRYVMGGQARALLVAARELDPQALPARSWFNTRLQFTHGYGLVAASASAVGPDGRPVFVERDVPPQGDLGLVRPEIYFGERTTEPALVRPAESVVDYARGDEALSTPYQGFAGVPLDGPLARLAHAIRLPDLNLVLSPAVGPESALLHHRQVAERVQQLAPFLLLDADPYPVVVDGRLVWLLDGYTASDRFPFAPRAPARLLAPDPRPGQTRSVEPNYLRGAVKATVDAYDGAVNLYLSDARDPIAATYARIYPGLLKPFDSMPAALRSHVRYPQQLFMVQADALARFHVSDPGQLYSGEDAWLVARGRLETRADARPLYGLQRLPGEVAEELALTLPFRPYSQANDRHNLVALLAARSGPSRSPNAASVGGSYGELVLYRYPRDRPVEGPFQAELRIDQDPLVSAQFGLWQRSGAQVVRGEVQTIPLGNSVLYLQSIYLQRAERSALPELQRVVAVTGGRVVMEPSLEAALSGLYGVALNLPGPAGAGPPAATTPSVGARELALSAQEHLQRAQEALFAGDRARHERELQAAIADLQRLAETTP
jgi:uncharacterized membrane protein (UPF0182 family)